MTTALRTITTYLPLTIYGVLLATFYWLVTVDFLILTYDWLLLTITYKILFTTYDGLLTYLPTDWLTYWLRLQLVLRRLHLRRWRQRLWRLRTTSYVLRATITTAMSEYALLLLRATTGVLLRCTTTADDYYVLRTTITYYDDVLQCTPYDYDYDYNVRILRSAMYAVLLRRLQPCTITHYTVRRIVITTYYDVLRTA